MILLWGLPSDPPLRAVWNGLQHLGAEVAFLDQGAVLATEVELEVGAQVRGSLAVGDQRLDLAEIRGVYLRPFEWCRLPAIERAGPGTPEWSHALAVEDALVYWAEVTEALVVNRPSLMASNNSKPYQAARIEAAGFAIPATLITTDPRAARAFWEERGEVIYKSVSGTRSIVSRLTADHMDRLDDVCWCPTQFQQWVPGRDYRVHVVGDEIFACEIASAADDYRYAARSGSPAALQAVELPADCAARCRDLARALELPFSGIDLRRTPEGAWYCFEVNTSPGFFYFESATGLPIADAVARLLLSPP
jgi:hypothetical protein